MNIDLGSQVVIMIIVIMLILILAAIAISSVGNFILNWRREMRAKKGVDRYPVERPDDDIYPVSPGNFYDEFHMDPPTRYPRR